MYLCPIIAFEAFKIERHQETVAESGDSAELDLFSPENIEHTLDILLPSLFKAVQDESIGCAPLVLSSCLLAFLWLLDEEGVSALCIIMPVWNNIIYPYNFVYLSHFVVRTPNFELLITFKLSKIFIIKRYSILISYIYSN